MKRLSSLFARHGHANWAFADQAVVSGSNFVTGILLARFLGPESFGLFVLLNLVMLYVNSFQGALIFTPMISAAPQLSPEKRDRYLRGVFGLQLVLSLGLALLALALGKAAIAFNPYGVGERLTDAIVVALACALLAFQLQDLQRRYYFVLENARAAFANDVISYGGQVTLIVLLGLRETLTVATAFAIIAGSSFTAFAVGCLHSKLRPAMKEARDVLFDGWRTGRDYLVAWQFQWIGTQGVLMVGGGLLGTQAAGAVRAVQNVVGPFNLVFQTMDNVIPVMAARRYADRGMDKLVSFLWRISLLGTAVLLPILAALAVFAEPIVHALYGARYVDAAELVALQAAYVFLQFHLRQVLFFLRTLTATGAIIRTGMVMAGCAIFVAFFSIDAFHLPGVMLAYLSGTLAALVYGLFASRNLIRQNAAATQPSAAGDGILHRARKGA